MIRKTNITYTTLLFISIFIVIFITSNAVVWMCDDFVYQFIFKIAEDGTKNVWSNPERIESLSDIIRSQNAHYLTMNGRYVAHFMVQLFVGIVGQTWFSILNALAYIALIVLVVKLSGAEMRFQSLLTAATMVLISYDTLYLVSFQIGYVWMPVLTCIWVSLYKSEKKVYNAIWLILYFLYSIVAGNGHESYNLCISGALITCLVMKFKQISPKQWTMFFGFGVGSLLLCLSPGTLNRAGGESVDFINTCLHFFMYSKSLYVLIVMMIIKKIQGVDIVGFLKENIFWASAFIIGILFVFAIGIYDQRQLLGVELFAIILTIKLLGKQTFDKYMLVTFGVIASMIMSIKFITVSKERQICECIEKLYVESKNGLIYYDIPYNKGSKFVAPCPFVHYNNPYNESEIESLGKVLRYKYHTDKQLRIYPTAMRDGEIKNQAIDFCDGCYYLLQDKANPADFYVTREYKFLFFTYPRDEYPVSFDSDKVIENENYRAIVFHNTTPLINNTGVLIKPSK